MKCEVRGWNLSYECLTSYNARERLWQEKNNDTPFWNELQKKSLIDLRPTDDEVVSEDAMPCVNMDEEDGPDDSDIMPAEVVADIVGKQPQRCLIRQADGGGLSSAADTDSNALLDVAVEVPAEEKGRGKRKKKENQLYAGWWRHEAKDGTDMPGEPGMDISI